MGNKAKSCQMQIEERIYAMPESAVFVTSDFCDMADPDTASKALLRLNDSGRIRRILRGVYTRTPNENQLVSTDSIARAIARSNGWSIAPSGNTALYLVGLSSKPPAVWTYVSDGTYREYTADGVSLRFQHTSGKLLDVSPQTALIVQVLKAYGKDKLTDELLKYLSQIFCHGDEEMLLRESRKVSAWICQSVRKMCMCRAGA